MSIELLIDGMMSGTGVRDAINGGYVQLADLHVSDELVSDIEAWQEECRQAHLEGHPAKRTEVLDSAGLVLRDRLQAELPNKQIGYYSDGRMQRLA